MKKDQKFFDKYPGLGTIFELVNGFPGVSNLDRRRNF
jgi:hypothetical protein